MKKTIYLLIFLILISGVYADKVSIFNFNYDDGKIVLKEQLIKEGYYPDRYTDIKEGYRCEIIGREANKLYSFDFELPMLLYTDVIINHTIFGNVIILNKTDFSFVVPYLPRATKLICYNQGGYEIINEEIEKIILSPLKRNNWWILYLFLALVGFLILIYKSRKNKTNT